MIVLIDNYDSFTWNIVQLLAAGGTPVEVVRNDAVTLAEIERRAPSHLVVSPGPGTPTGAGISLAAIEHFAGRVPILGVCLGHQAIGQVFGGTVVRARTVMHGKVSPVSHTGEGIFHNLPSPFGATRYHSLAVARDSLPECLEVTAWTADGEVMGLRHRAYAVEGVQFHPESILTEHGAAILRAFVRSRDAT